MKTFNMMIAIFCLFFLQSCNQGCGNLTQDIEKNLLNQKCHLQRGIGNMPSDENQDDQAELGVDLRWVPIAASTEISSRKLHSSVLIGNKMCVWGGHNIQYLQTGACQNLDTGMWSEMSTANAPSARVYHASVSTGTEMCIWGGFNGSSSMSDGACYNPSNNSWRPISSAGSPAASMDLDGVWTGSEFCLFGGAAKHCYNPATDSWRVMISVNIPSARSSHATVWTGKEMCVWGGNSSTQQKTNTGGCYNPSNNTWTTITQIGAPVGRERTEGAYVDGHFCVFGGRIADSPITMANDGGCYHLESQSWSLIEENHLDAREHVSAISNGKEFCVWGGQSATQKFGDGSCYNPVGQTWRVSVNDASTPTARVSHTAIWYNKKMCIWGGDDGGFSGNGACLEFE